MDKSHHQKALTPYSPLTPLNSQSPDTSGQGERLVSVMSESTTYDPFGAWEAQNGSRQQFTDSMASHTRQSSFQDPQTSDEAAPAAVDQSLAHGEKIKNLVRCIQDLRHQGVDSSIDLPKVCVVGDQSAGKSSLVQSLSGIKIPRSDGTCTRCPLEVNLTSIESREGWYCRVFIINKYTLDSGSKRNPQKINHEKPMGPWTLAAQPLKMPFAETGKKEEVHDLIRLAQQAILNPSLDPAQFRYVDAPDTMEVKFSPNNVCLDISGPGYCDLSFIDLPGVIAETELKSERYLVDIVKNLMIEHIQSESCIIILTLSMTEDIENSNAFGLIRKNDAELRSLGVLTKPDYLSEGNKLDRWKKVLLGNSQFNLGYGFHIVMMDADKTLLNEEVIAREELYFAKELWRLMQSEKLGVPSLSRSLQNLLSLEVSKQLPNITEKINARALTIDNCLKRLPTRPSTSQYPIILAQLLTRFGIHMTSLFDGYVRDAAANRLKVKLAFIAEAFRGALVESRPLLTLSSTAESTQCAKVIPDSGEVGGSRKSTPMVEAVARVSREANSDSLEMFAQSKTLGVTFSFEEIGRFNQEFNFTNIPNQIAPQAIEKMNKKSVAHWEKPVSEFMKHVEDLIKSEIMHLAADVFQEYQDTQLYRESTKMITDFLYQACDDQRVEVIKAYRMEHCHPLTLDKEGLTRSKKEALETIKTARHKYRVHHAQAVASASDGPAKGKAKSVSREEPDLSPDPFETHIEIMANVKSYYHLAASRFADNVCQSTQARLFTKCGEEIEPALEDYLGIAEDNDSARSRIAMLMSDNPAREVMRNSLAEEKERLKRAQRQLQGVLSSGENVGVSGVEEQIGVDTDMYDGLAVKPESPKSLTPRTPGGRKRRRGLELGE